MKYSILLVFVLISSCTKSIECDDPVVQSLFINVIDADGNNLIDKGEIMVDDIIVRYKEQEIVNAVFSDVESIKNLISINLNGPEGSLIYEIQFSESSSDTLVLELTELVEDDSCNNSIWALNSVSYNGVNRPIEDFNGDFLITVTLE